MRRSEWRWISLGLLTGAVGTLFYLAISAALLAFPMPYYLRHVLELTALTVLLSTGALALLWLLFGFCVAERCP
jgi:hypothetical protein